MKRALKKRCANSRGVVLAKLSAVMSDGSVRGDSDCGRMRVMRQKRTAQSSKDCVDVNVVGKNVSYTALGHIHKAQQVKDGHCAWYAGSALPMSFAEKNYQHGVNLVDIDTAGETEVMQIHYQPLRNLITIPVIW